MFRNLIKLALYGFLCLFIFVGGFLFALKVSEPEPSLVSDDIIWSLIQNWRISNNLQPYIKDEKVCDIAKIRLYETSKNWSHDGFDDDKFYRVIECNGLCELAENLASDFTDNQLVLDSWLNSPTHRKNLEYDYKYACLVTDGNYVVHTFANY